MPEKSNITGGCVMYMKTKFGLVIAIIAVVFITSGWFGAKNKCGDGVCQKWEERRGSCPQDCEKSIQPSSGTSKLKSIRVVKESGGNLDWCHKTDRIAYCQMGSDGYFDIWVMNSDRTNDKCITSNVGLPDKHIGNPAWHPSGEYLVIQAQKRHVPKAYDNKCTPGAGMLSDLYIITDDGRQHWLLHAVSDKVSKDSSGVLHAHFSHDGRKLTWAQRTRDNGRKFGEWAIKIADFEMTDSGPTLSNIKHLQPGRSAWYETHNFSPDDRKLLFTGSQDGPFEIYELDVQTHKVKRLTHSSSWDEHALYSPDGKKIVWMSSEGLTFKSKPNLKLETEFWLMNKDGSGKERLTYFHQKGHPHYFTSKSGFVVAADSSWSPDGKRLLALVITADPKSDRRHEGRILMLEFE